ncbi:hypothetical protein BDZ89DRAFT_1055605 [Hymenopellis radicata]|nr:hypothetical protein BDZ89DRAFT_1055605 [Hymenopellis radicata]
MSTTMVDRRSLEYAPSLSSIAASTSSPSTADASPRLDSVLTLSTQATSSTNHRRAPRRSLSLLDKIPKDFSSLLRSHNSSRRHSAIFQSDPPSKVVYADEHPYDRTITANNMYALKEDERQTRKQKPESRFYSFLTRSRSRSRPKNDPALDHESIVPELARDYGSHSRQSSASIREKSHGDKPTISINPASRPLSTTTTATNTTIMPPTPKARRTATPLVAVPAPAHPNENTSRPSTPKIPSNTRKKLHNIFGIPLSGPRKSDSRKSSLNSTRPNTPDPLVATNAPPLPATCRQGSSHDPIPSAPRKIPAPLNIVRPESPSLGSRSRQATFDSLESSTSTSASTSSKRDHNFKSQKLFLARVPTSSPTSSHFDDRPGMSSGAPLIVSGPHKHRRAYTSHSDSLVTPVASSAPIHRNVQAPQPRRPDDGNSVISGVPRITHTPATPQRPETTPPRLSQRKNSLDSSRRHREMSVVDEERSMLDVELDKGKRRGDTSRQGHHSVVSKMKSNVRSTRHGSFDFERPGWGTGSIVRSPSGNSTSTTATGPKGSGSGETLPQAARSGEISGKGKMREMSTSDVLKRRGSHRTAPSPIPPLEPDYTGASASTTHSKSTTGTNGQSSSLGRSTGKRMLEGGVAKLVGIPHGPFSFEPPVPSPAVSTSTQASGLGDYEKETEERGKVERRRKRREVMREEAEGREKAARRAESKPLPILPTNVGFRSATKGRSLDLGLGLSWAPTKVREDALLPSSTFALDKRSFSASSRVGMRRNWSQDEEDESKLGKDIAEKFRNALDADGYTTFKQYVHRFDAQEIPIDGPHGIIARARRLLDRCSILTLTEGQKDRLTDDLFKIILQNA